MNKQKNSSHRVSHFVVISRILPYLFPRSFKMACYVIFGLLFLILTIFLNISVPLLFKKVLQILSDTKHLPEYTVILGLCFYSVAWLFSRLISQLRQIVMYPVFERAIRNVCLRLFKHLNSMSLRFHYDDRKIGAIINSIDRASIAMPSVFWGMLFLIFPTIVEVVIASSILWYLFGPLYASILLGFLLLYIVISYYGTSWAAKLQRISNEKDKAVSAFVTDSLLNCETLKYFPNQEAYSNYHDRLLKDRESVTVKQLVLSGLLGLTQAVLSGTALILLTILSGLAVYQNKLSISDFVLVNTYIMQFLVPLGLFGLVIRQIREGLTNMENFVQLMDMEETVKDVPGAEELSDIKGDIEFKNVSFMYRSDVSLIKNLSFSISAGETLAIVGPSGSGKSTIIKLLMRLYDVDEGEILIDGKAIRNVQQDSLRKAISIVPQNIVLFNDSLRFNLSYWLPETSDEEILNAMKLARLDQFLLKQPAGLDTVVGEHGVKLSGGEKQRLGIARALLNHSSVYIFDEATSALDSETEKAIYDNFCQVTSDATVITIAHRLSTIKNVKTIMVIEKGKIVEMGDHYSLLNEGGVYARLWEKQVC